MDNKQEAKYIERIEIKGLWGRYDVDWKLNRDVNILVGENGTGKSTILDILFRFFKFQVTKKNLFLIFNKAKLSYRINEEKKNYDAHIHEGTVTFRENHTTKSGYSISTIPEYEQFLLNFISTFDTNPFDKTEYVEKNKTYINTHLDQDLDAILPQYIVYQNKLLRKNGDRVKTLEKNNFFFETINRLFEPTKKKIFEDNDITDANLMLKFMTEDNKKLSVFELSSGEKQLLLILLTVLCQDEKPFILLMDEPEISLHLRWQYELIEIIRTLNPNCQIIIVTHSPSIFGKGWRDKLFWIEDIVKKKEVINE